MKLVFSVLAIVFGSSVIPQLCAQTTRTLASSGLPGKRAFVIGNDAYRINPLRTSVKDAQIIRKSLQDDQFTVDLVINADAKRLEQEIERFVAMLAKDDIAIVYYSGRGIQLQNENYLVPVDFDAKNVIDAKYASYSVARLIERIEAADVRLCVLILDASPQDSLVGGESDKRSLAVMTAGAKTFIAMSSAPGALPVDLPDSRNGVFAGFLSDALLVPDLTLDQLFGQVRTKVYDATAGHQVPVVSVSADSSTVLVSGANQAPHSRPTETFENEWKQWQSIKDKPNTNVLSAFLNRFPEGAFHDAATTRMHTDLSSASPVNAIAPKTEAGSSSGSIRNMAQLPKREVDPNFDFKEADYELLTQCDALDKRYEREGLILNDPELQEYLDRVGRSILPSATPTPNVRWRFLPLRDPVPNAFALPDGSVYVNTGLLAVLDNESQLASVLAHEITHVTGRHGYEANRSARKKALTVSLVQMGASYAPVGNNWSESFKLAASVLPVIMQASILGYQRELERQADLYALEKLSNTGYDPREMANAFRHLQETNEVELQTVYYGDHPKLKDRIDYVNTHLAGKKVNETDLFPTQAATYRIKTERALRADVQLAITSGRRRTANSIANKLVQTNPNSAENLIALADSYRALGPWTPKPEPEELSKHAKKQLAKAKAKLTPAEEEAAFADSDEGREQMATNSKLAAAFYKKALSVDPQQVAVFKSLGRLYEGVGEIEPAKEAYGKYISLTTDYVDADRTRQRLSTLDSNLKLRVAKKGRS